MNKYTGKYLGELRTSNLHEQSGSEILTDAPVDNHGKGETFSPTDLVSAALGACMTTIMGIEARKINADLTGLTYDVQKVMNANPRRIREIKIHFSMPDNHSLTPEQISHLKEKGLSCPVALSLSEELTQTITFNF